MPWLGMIKRGWLAGTLTAAIQIGDAHLPDWKYLLIGLLVGVATWGLPREDR